MANIYLTNAKGQRTTSFILNTAIFKKEIEAYLEFDPDVFRDKVVYCNCDDPFEQFLSLFCAKFQQAWIETAHHHRL